MNSPILGRVCLEATSLQNLNYLPLAISEIFQGSHDVTMPLSGMVCQLSSIDWDIIRSTCSPNLKSLCSPTTKMWKAMQNAEIGVVLEGKGSRKVIGNISIQYRTYDFLDTNRNYATILHGFRVIGSYLLKVADFNLPCLHLMHWGWPCLNFIKIFGIRRLESLRYHVALMVYVNLMDGQTDTHTHTTVLRLCGICPGQPRWAGTRRNIQTDT